MLHRYAQVYKVCYSEAGVAVVPSHFFQNGDKNAYFTSASAPFRIDTPGEYQVRLKSGLLSFKATLIIEDTIAPQASVVSVSKPVGSDISPEEFVTDIRDATAVTVSFAPAAAASAVPLDGSAPVSAFVPDTSVAGRYEIPIYLRDQGGNETVLTAILWLSDVLPVVYLEAGDPLPALDDFVVAAHEAAFVTDISGINTAIIGEHEIVVAVDGGIFTSILAIVDTIPPLFTVADISGFAILPREAADFVTSCHDVTMVDFHFATPPDLEYIGSQSVTIVARDDGGNESTQTATLTLIADTEKPVIRGAADLEAQTGDTVAYMRHVVAIDNCPDGLQLTVDQSAVNINLAGTYPVTYIARDAAGNESRVTVNINVRPKHYDLDQIYARADEILARIFTEGMSEREKLWAIYRYNMNNIFFESHSEKETWVRAAYEGLFDKRGDCYVYASTAKVLLDRAGIMNEDIEKIVTTTRHYWHLVDIGEGWYHFDTTPRSDKVTIFMWTNAQIEELMEETRYRSHRYDPDIYPTDRRPIN